MYNSPHVVGHYATAQGLLSCESYTFDKYIRRGDDVLDLGVGGGRTTPDLSTRAGHYVGVDYSQSMVESCRERFPTLEFHCDNAADLSRFGNSRFDIVVFSANGIDYITSEGMRANCLREIKRVLRPGGRFIFSSHNARNLGPWPLLAGASPIQAGWRIARFVWFTIRRAPATLTARVFWKGHGYVYDPDKGGFYTFVSTPESVAIEVRAAGFDIAETINTLYPARPPSNFVPWYYYVLTKT
jgi:SAM-dependent methyltransferase